ncbi:hypothetical protein X946_5372 [Burkholderia sp. ABCPW 111]|nr:hypothetical protein X946_5372 [Burkholderia sp. ABCPW 111]
MPSGHCASAAARQANLPQREVCGRFRFYGLMTADETGVLRVPRPCRIGVAGCAARLRETLRTRSG